jgi:predicted HTH domain antitoxin
LRKGFEEDKMERVLSRYQESELSAGEVCKILDISRWELLALLKKKNMSLNVILKDWLDSARLE